MDNEETNHKDTHAKARTSKKYWTGIWTRNALPKPLDPHNRSVKNIVNIRFHELFVKYVSAFPPKTKAIEIGCARSQILPYFIKEYGFHVAGVDYSSEGCKQAENMLKNEGMEGHIICADMFDMPSELLEQYDIVYSGGLIEHFDNTAEAIRACASVLKEGGLMITTIPNIVGMIGFFQKLVDKTIYDIHVPLDRKDLKQAHEDAGLDVIQDSYFMFLNNNVVVLDNVQNRLLYIFWKILLSGSTRVISLFEHITGWQPPPNRMTSPYVVTVAKKIKK